MNGPGESMLVVDNYMMRIQVAHNIMEDNMLQDLTGHRNKRYWPVVADFFLTAFFKHWGHICTFPVTWDLTYC